VHEWIERSGGAEKVVRAMLEALPDSDLYCLWNDSDADFARTAEESWFSKTPLRRHKALALPFMPMTWRRLAQSSSHDWVLVSSHLFAHHVRLRGQPDVPRFVYVHTPARYIWTPSLDERGSSMAVKAVAPLLRNLDKRRANEPGQHFAANSDYVRSRVESTWGVEATVIYPPVGVAHLTPATDWFGLASPDERRVLASLPSEYLLGASRFVPYKRLDQVIRIGAAMKLPVVIAGSGPGEESLRVLAAELSCHATFIISPSDACLYELQQKAFAYIFPPIEDFGIMPVEAMALGARVLVNATGGTAESVVDRVSGAHVQDFADLREVEEAMSRIEKIATGQIQQAALRFSEEQFRQNVVNWVQPRPGSDRERS
jgi:glycosyltransferase involved in cell wall biosynthesis